MPSLVPKNSVSFFPLELLFAQRFSRDCVASVRPPVQNCLFGSLPKREDDVIFVKNPSIAQRQQPENHHHEDRIGCLAASFVDIDDGTVRTHILARG